MFDEPYIEWRRWSGMKWWKTGTTEAETDLEILILAIIAMAEFKFTAAGEKLQANYHARPEKLFSAAWLLNDR